MYYHFMYCFNRQLRIANQKIRDFELHVSELKDDLNKTKKNAVGKKNSAKCSKFFKCFFQYTI